MQLKRDNGAPWTRREFIGKSAGTALFAAGGLGMFGSLPRVSAGDARIDGRHVRFNPEIEPLVRLLENTPRQRLLEEVGSCVKSGTSYREILAALMLAGVRNIQPRPVGFKFHAVLVVHSAHLASLNSPDADRWLPVFWALDRFKAAQAQDIAEGDWTMDAVDEKSIPAVDRAGRLFAGAMDRWDEAEVDIAAAALARGGNTQAAFDLFCHYGARDYRDIGHKAIYVANSWRTLQTIGWQHAEPVLRSLAYALLMHRGGNPAERDALPDRPGRTNRERLKQIRATWNGGDHKPETVVEMLAVLRDGSWDDASAKVVELLNRGSAPQAIWDALFHGAAELLMRRPGIISLHACTTANAMNHAFRHVADDETRRFVLLQTASFMPLFRGDADAIARVSIDQFEPLATAGSAADPLEDIFADLPSRRLDAARKTLAYLDNGGDAASFVNAAQRLIYLKGRDSHDYKFSSAIIEDYHHLSPAHRNRFLAASVHWLKGSAEPDSPLVERTRAALG
jgi:hypothetical protein